MRTRPPLHLTQSPLVFVLAQARFSPIAKMEAFAPQIQETLRRKGFPGYQVRTTQELTFGPVPQASQSQRWFFSSKEGTSAVILSTDFVVLATSTYEHFEDLVANFEIALAAVQEASEPSFATRVGLRYVDLIRPAERESLDEYLQPGLHGVRPEEIEASAVSRQFHLTAKTRAGTISVRLWQNTEGKILPPDLVGDEVEFRVPPAAPGELLTVLDLDHYSRKQQEFAPALLIADLWALHDGTDLAFRRIVTEQAIARWGGTPAPTN